MMVKLIIPLLLGFGLVCTAETQSSVSGAIPGRLNVGSTKTCLHDETIESAVLHDISASLRSASEVKYEDLCVPKGVDDVIKAMKDFSPESDNKGRLAWNFLKGLANSEAFVEHIWHKHPLLIRAEKTGGWIENSFTVERDLR